MSTYAQLLITKIKNVLDELSRIRFAENEIILQEEKKNIQNEYEILLEKVESEKSTIERQTKPGTPPVMPFQFKTLKEGYCYFCGRDIRETFSFYLSKEVQEATETKVVEGARFCSQKCLQSYCKEYAKHKELLQEEEKKIKERIDNDKKAMGEVMAKKANLISKINELEKKE